MTLSLQVGEEVKRRAPNPGPAPLPAKQKKRFHNEKRCSLAGSFGNNPKFLPYHASFA